MDSLHYAYLMGAFALAPFWFVLFFIRKDTRKQMSIMSLAIGVLSVVTSYYWWTVDWWQPVTIAGTKVGIEDFIMGFFSGGIMSVIYEVLFSRRQYKMRRHNMNSPDAVKLLLFMAFVTSFLFWGVGLTSFWASTVALTATASIMCFYRKDLLINSISSGVLMALISSVFYAVIHLVSPQWISTSYLFETLSGELLFGVPVEEFVFWFLAGLFFGPLYEYWQDKRLRKSK